MIYLERIKTDLKEILDEMERTGMEYSGEYKHIYYMYSDVCFWIKNWEKLNGND
jgi:hypothetical protein